MKDTDTLYAPITGRGGAVCVYRLSGPDVLSKIQALTGRVSFKPRYSYKVSLISQEGDIIDPSALVTFFPGPKSYTGEDVAEVHLHASKVVSDHFCSFLHKKGLRLAEPGEFSRRAVLNGKMTLDEALGVRYLIESQTQQQYRAALAQMTGQDRSLVHQDFENVREHLLLLLRDAEASLEFPDEEDISREIERSLTKKMQDLLPVLKNHQKLYEKKEMLRAGIPVVLMGPPNVGKSSLLNALAREEYALVSDIPGTTRDVVQVLVNWGGYAVRLIDTAGLRETEDPLERMGMARTLKQEESARITLLMLDEKTLDQEAVLRQQCQSPNIIVVFTKADVFFYPQKPGVVSVSSQTRVGLDHLEFTVQSILEVEFSGAIEKADMGETIKVLLDRALIGLTSAIQEKRLEIRVQILYDLAEVLASMIPDIDREEVMDRIFSGFCIGK